MTIWGDASTIGACCVKIWGRLSERNYFFFQYYINVTDITKYKSSPGKYKKQQKNINSAHSTAYYLTNQNGMSDAYDKSVSSLRQHLQ